MDTQTIFIENAGEVTFTYVNGVAYYLANDVAKAYEFSKPRDAVTKYCRNTEDVTDNVILLKHAFVTGKKKDGSSSIQMLNTKFINTEMMLELYERSKSDLKDIVKEKLLEFDNKQGSVNNLCLSDNVVFKSVEHTVFGEFTIAIVNNMEFFPATRTATVLGYKNAEEAIRNHCLKEGCVILSPLGVGGRQATKYISEGNLYRLLVKSQLPYAKKFEKWVFDEVIPSIRRTGSYVNPAHNIDISNSNFENQSELIRIEKSKILRDLVIATPNEKMKNTLTILSANILFDKPVLEYEKAEKPSYPASKIAEKLLEKYNISITVAMIGRLANRHGLKTDENGYLAYDKSKSSIKQVETFRYYDNVVPVLYDIILSDTKLKNKYIKE